MLATSREPLGVAGEAAWQVPSLSLSDDAIELFADRARLARTGFAVNDDNAGAVAEICRRLDGMPLAIELAAARVRTLSLTEIVDSLHDRFRLLTGGSRIAVRRQQTLRASVDWSHALLTDTERVLFRRLAVFLGGFDLDAAQAVTGADGVERYQVLDQLTLLVDKSLVVAENAAGQRDTGYWKPCANMRWKNSASPAKPTPSGPGTATTTRRSRPCSTRRHARTTSSASISRKSRWTTCAAHWDGIWRSPTMSAHCRWRRRCNRSG